LVQAVASWVHAHAAPLVNSAGLLLDILGAFLIASEVVKQYRAKKYDVSGGFVVGPLVHWQNVEETREFRE